MAEYTGEIYEVRGAKSQYQPGESVDLFVHAKIDGYNFSLTDTFWDFIMRVYDVDGNMVGEMKDRQIVAAWERDHDWKEHEYTFRGIGTQTEEPGLEGEVILSVLP